MAQAAPRLAQTGYYASKPAVVGAIFSQLIGEGSVKIGSKLLDLGAGTAEVVIEAARCGINSYGIEINPLLVAGARGNIREARERNEISEEFACEIVEGNYFSREYIELRLAGSALAPAFENGDFVYFDGKRPYTGCFREERFFPYASEPDPYKLLGVRLEDFDTFFSYSWGIELPSQLEMFALFAKDSALFVNRNAVNPANLSGMLSQLGLRFRPRGVKDFSFTEYAKSGKTP